MPGAGVLTDWLGAQLPRLWFGGRRSAAALLLRPLGGLYRLLSAAARAVETARARRSPPLAVPVVVVGNLIVGGAGKTPVTISLVEALRRAGFVPGVVSRGWGRASTETLDVRLDSDPALVGDEPMLIARRTGAPVVVGRDRRQAAHRLLRDHPETTVVVADDGLQHRRLARDVEVVVFDERGVGNGLLLPAGPLRQPFTERPAPRSLVLYTTATPSTPWPGWCAVRRLTGAWPLHEWLDGPARVPVPLESLRGRPLIALAGIAVPERFFAALEQAGLQIRRQALPDHHRYVDDPVGDSSLEVVTTEKDAVKLAAWRGRARRVWVVGLDLALPDEFVNALLARLPRAVPR